MSSSPVWIGAITFTTWAMSTISTRSPWSGKLSKERAARVPKRDLAEATAALWSIVPRG
jgi:hypothetical protein